MNRYMLPQVPEQNIIKTVYPWNDYQLKIIYASLYQHAVDTGYNKTLEEFQSELGDFLARTMSITEYNGQYEVTPLPVLEQILRTQGTYLAENVVVLPIPYYETTNNAGGYTVFIG